jgi:hypothetical protein
MRSHAVSMLDMRWWLGAFMRYPRGPAVAALRNRNLRPVRPSCHVDLWRPGP